jgi:hypothetical protein
MVWSPKDHKVQIKAIYMEGFGDKNNQAEVNALIAGVKSCQMVGFKTLTWKETPKLSST